MRALGLLVGLVALGALALIVWCWRFVGRGLAEDASDPERLSGGYGADHRSP